MAESIEANRSFKTGVPEKAEKMPEKAEKKPEKTEKMPAKAEKTGSNVPEQPSVPPMPEKAETKIDRVALRKTLSVLNKATGENTARKMINDMGFKALTDVPDDRLAELKTKAEAVIKNAQ
jgi:hypothetical protein